MNFNFAESVESEIAIKNAYPSADRSLNSYYSHIRMIKEAAVVAADSHGKG